jgi:hypothetical protein
VTEHDKSVDLLGIKPVSEAINTVTKATTEGAGAFLSRICLPAAEEFGFLLRDKVSAWRAKNALTLTKRAEEMLDALSNSTQRHAHPRIVGAIIEKGSWNDENDISSMWAGLLATSCTESGRSEENLIYVNLLGQLTASQTRILNFACSEAIKCKTGTGLIFSQDFIVTLEQIVAASGTTDIHVLDLEIDNLRELGLLNMDSGLDTYSNQNNTLTPSAVGLQLFVRCQGFIGSPIEYFKV